MQVEKWSRGGEWTQIKIQTLFQNVLEIIQKMRAKCYMRKYENYTIQNFDHVNTTSL